MQIGVDGQNAIAAKAFERMLQCVIAAMDRYRLQPTKKPAIASSACQIVVSGVSTQSWHSFFALACCGMMSVNDTRVCFRHVLSFAAFLPAFLTLYGHAALSAMSAAELQRVRPKTRVLLVRFISRALLCPVYSQAWLDSRTSEGPTDA